MSVDSPRKLDYASPCDQPSAVVAAMQIAIISIGCTLITLIAIVLGGGWMWAHFWS